MFVIVFVFCVVVVVVVVVAARVIVFIRHWRSLLLFVLYVISFEGGPQRRKWV